jgi:hypothetical protein
MILDTPRDPYHPETTGWFQHQLIKDRAAALIECEGLHVTHHPVTGELYRPPHERAVGVPYVQTKEDQLLGETQ